MTFADLVYRAWAWLYNNKQSWLGGLTAALAFVQASPTLRNLLSTGAYEWLMFGAGLLMVLFARSAAGGAVASKVIPPSIPSERTPKDGGFIRPLVLGILLAIGAVGVVALPGCTAIGLQQPKSFEEGWAYALGQTTALRTAAAEGVRAGSLTADDGEYVLKVTDQSRALLDAARATYGAGDVETAEGRLALVSTILSQLQSYLRSKGGAS